MADTTDTDQQPQPASPQPYSLDDLMRLRNQLLQTQPIQAPQQAFHAEAPTTGWVQSLGRGLTRNLPYPVDAEEEEAAGRASLLGMGGGFAGMAAPAQAEAAQQAGLLQLQREQQNQQIEAMKASTPLMNLQLQMQQLQQWQRLYGPQATTPPAGGFPGAVKGAESGGNASARNPLSSAAGPAQFITSTWSDFLKSPQGVGFTEADRVAPPNADAATVARVQAANTAAVNWYAGVNNQAFQDKLGRQATPAELASGHLLGPGYAVKLAQADPNTAVKDVLPANFISNNPNVFTPNMTVANARQSIGGFYGVGGAAGVVPAIAPAPGRVQLAGPPSAVTQPPAAQPTPDQLQLPTPPVPPAGLPPTIASRQDALDAAKALGREVPVPGMQGDTAKPAGTVGPPSGGWLQPKAPVTPPAQPAPQPATQQPAETAPAPAATTGPATAAPVTPFRMTPQTSRAEWDAAHPVDPGLGTTFAPTPEQTKNLQTNIDTALEQRNTTATQLKAAIENRDRLTRLAGMGPTIGGAANPAVAQLDGANRSVAQLTEASNRAADAYSAAVKSQNDIIQTGIANRQKSDEQRNTQYLADVANAQKSYELERGAQLEPEKDVMKGLNETFETARTASDQIDLARALSRSAGDPSLLQMVQKNHPGLVQWMANLGGLSDEQMSQLGLAGATDAAMNKLISMARTGSGFQRMTNLDVQILSSQAPTSIDPQAWREAKLSYLQSYMARQMRYVDAVRSMRADGVPLYEAQRRASTDVGDVVPTVPTYSNLPPAQAAAAREKWADSVAPNTFIRMPDGQLRIWPPPQTQTTQTQAPAAWRPQGPTQ